MIRVLLLVPFALGCAAPRAETVAVPGTRIRFEMVPVTGDSRAALLSTRPVTWADFDRFGEFPGEEKADGVTRPSSGKSYLQLSGLPPETMEPDKPVTNVRYHAAIAYAEWVSKLTGRVFRLPTEREWDLARPGPTGLWEYSLEPDRPPDFEPVLRDGPRRTTAPASWSEADPNRPFSLWWFRAGHSQGFRLVQVPGATLRAPGIAISGFEGRDHVARVGNSATHWSRVTGEVRNDGDRAIDELALKVYALDPEGKPHLEDVSANLTRRATFNVCHPVLTTSAHPGGHARPLGPGERRRFEVDLPMSLDPPEHVRPGAFGAAVLHARFAER